MTSLAQYDRARAALAEATRVDEILPLRDEVAHLKLHARQIKDRVLLAEAHVFQARVERKLGTVILAAKEAGQITQGRKKADDGKTQDNGVFRINLADVGIDHNLSARAQKSAATSEQVFEQTVQALRERIAAGKAKIVSGEVINGARSVMGSRAEPDGSLDFFPTPPWATRALIERVFPQISRRGDCKRSSAWEPACGEGHIAEVLREYFGKVCSTDIHDYGYGEGGRDFLDPDADAGADWIITNPPFGDLTEKFVLLALDRAKVGVAMFVRMQWLETVGRYETIFRNKPPTCIAFFAERVPLCKGRWDPDGDTATAYIWLVWVKGASPRAPYWIPPGQRDALTLETDRESFTSRPVVRRDYLGSDEAVDLNTGEIADVPLDGCTPAVVEHDGGAAPLPVAPPSPRPPIPEGEHPLDIPAFLRRRPLEKEPAE